MADELAPGDAETENTPAVHKGRQRRNAFIALVAATLVAVVASVIIFILDRLEDDPIPLSTPSGELAFVSNRDGQWDIYTLGPDGTLRNLTGANGANDFFASYSFLSDMINYLTDDSGEMGPGQVRPDGADLRTLSVTDAIVSVINEGRTDWDPNWSVGAEWLVWSSLGDFNLEIYVSPASSDERTRLTDDSALGPRDWFPSWSPDGLRITYSSDREGDENIYIMDRDGENLAQLTGDPGNDFHPAWSLDGSTILFVSERNQPLVGGNLELFLMDPDGGNQRPMADGDSFSGDPAYSADGSEVVYMSNEDGHWHIYLMNADGTNVRRLTEGDADYLFPVWRPVAGGP